MPAKAASANPFSCFAGLRLQTSVFNLLPIASVSLLFLFFVVTFLLSGCSHSTHRTHSTDDAAQPAPHLPSAGHSADAFAQLDPWLLRTTGRSAPRGNRGIFLGNGYIGMTFGAGGGGMLCSYCRLVKRGNAATGMFVCLAGL